MWKQKNAVQLPPARVALLDTAYLSGPHAWINNRWTGEVGRALVNENRSQIIYEAYRTSGATSNGFIGDNNQGLIDMVAFLEVKPWMYGAFDFTNKHNFAAGCYFDGMGYTAASVKCSGQPVPSAAQTSIAVRTLSTNATKYEQLDGKYSKSPGDDTWDQKGDDADFQRLMFQDDMAGRGDRLVLLFLAASPS